MEWFINWKDRISKSWAWTVKHIKNGLGYRLLSNGAQTVIDRSLQTLKIIIAKNYHLLVYSDGNSRIGNYSISKDSTYSANDACGADFCCIKEIENGLLVIFGDGAGHGIHESMSAILCMTVFNSTITEDPAEMLRRINRILYETRNKAYVMCVRIRHDEIYYCGRIEEATISGRHLNTNCAVLGVAEEYDCISKADKMELGDILLLRTDGAVYSDEYDDQTTVIIHRYA